MFNLPIRLPVKTLENQTLFPTGSVVSEKNLDALISQAGNISYKERSLLQHGSIEEDIIRIINTPPYTIIFSPHKGISDVMNVVESLQVPSPLLKSLDYFKIHDFYTYNHNLIVFALSTLLSEILISDDRDKPINTEFCPSHDIGKISVPFHILNKSEPLTLEERSILEHHAVAGYILLSYYLRDPLNIYAVQARDHHEKKDGSGYPQGIKLQNLLIEIVAVCDIYDALMSPRPYRPAAYSNRTAIEALTEMAEKNVLGWETIKALIALNRESKPQYTECNVSTEKRGTPPQDNNYGIYFDDNDD